MNKRFAFILILFIFILSPLEVFAFHQIHCDNEQKDVQASILSDARFGLIIRADLTYRDKTISYRASQEEGNDPFQCLHNGIVIVPFSSGENVILSRDEQTLSVYDDKGLSLGILTCSNSEKKVNRSDAFDLSRNVSRGTASCARDFTQCDSSTPCCGTCVVPPGQTTGLCQGGGH